MSSCINNSGSGNSGTSQDIGSSQAGERYFDDEGKLLPAHYPFIHDQTLEAAKRHNKDLSWLYQKDSLDKRCTAAKAHGWEIGGFYCRCSTDMQDSYQGQMASCIDRAIDNNVIVFPELAAGDEAISGKKSKRPGLELVKKWAIAGLMTVFVAFSISRLYRRLHTGLAFVRKDIIGKKVRLLAVAERIDSADKQFGMILNVNMMLAEMQASALPEFVRMGQKAHVENGFLVGACPLGYRPVPVPEAGMTKKGKAKTRPEVVPEVAEIICRAFKHVALGTGITAAWRQYNRDVAELPDDICRYAVDPRSTTKVMRLEAFRKLLSQVKFIGQWSFGKRRNTWEEREDGDISVIQVDAPEHEVVTMIREDLRIMPDELFHQVQRKLAEGTRGRHGPRTGREASLGTALINLYHCAECGHVFNYYGMQYMHCPESRKGNCNNWGTVNRDDAIKKIIGELRRQVLDNMELAAEIVRQSAELDARENDDKLVERANILEKLIRQQDTIMSMILSGCTGDGMDADDAVRYKGAKLEKTRLQAELTSLKARRGKERKPISEEEVMAILLDLDTLLNDAGAGTLGADGKLLAAALIRDLVGGSIKVSFARLQGRRAFGFGTFTPNPVLALAKRVDMDDAIALNLPAITVQFRELPRYARLADEAYRLYSEEGVSFTEIGKRLECGSGNAWGAFAYWHASRGLPVPYQRATYNTAKRKNVS